MSSRERKITKAWLKSPTSGVIELVHDWRARYMPPITLKPKSGRALTLNRLAEFAYGKVSGYYVSKSGELVFFLSVGENAVLSRDGVTLYVVGDFNGWQHGVGVAAWEMRRGVLGGEDVWMWTGRAEQFTASDPVRFKFVTGEHEWQDVSPAAPNAVRDESGSVNYVMDRERTGQHLFEFTVEEPLDLSISWSVAWLDGEAVALKPGDFFFALKSDRPLGAIVRSDETIFRIFAPRAKTVELCVCHDLLQQETPHRYPLVRKTDYTWEVTLCGNLGGWFYWYHITGPNDGFGAFDAEHRVLDPYALATVDRLGPGIIVDTGALGRAERNFKTPAWHDLVIVEAHVRDLAERAPIRMEAAERRGFTGLRKWVESPEFYLHHLGVNAVELQPVQEFDNATTEEYHWGYMTNNYFALESSYSLDPARASGMHEFRELVAAFHRRGMAVILDVVYNHVGEPSHLQFVDKLYYFEVDAAGALSNWSGCGNDLRARSAMATRLIIDSCIHLIDTYGVDGFRFDLAELLGVDVLKKIEVALKRAKSDVILIAEPWSFRGHVAAQLRDTGWASWNDGYRNFIRDYVRGCGTSEAYEYHLKGSPWHFAKWPAQTVNYTESHDDKTWIDMITENADGNGYSPTGNDRRRTHLMAAILFSSIGIPMLSAGQDFLRSKHGVNNTYLRGDLNALDYRRIYRFPSTHAYFADWIAFRRSDAGRLLRLYSRPSEGFFKFIFAPDSTAAATVYNADFGQGSIRLLFAVNPTLADAFIPVGQEIASARWRQVADQDRFFSGQRSHVAEAVEATLYIPPLSCGLWLSDVES